MDANHNTTRQERLLRKLPAEERLAALGAVFPLAPVHERDLLALLLIELAATRAPEPVVWWGQNARVRHAHVSNGAVEVLAAHWRDVPRGLRQLALAAARGRWGQAIEGLNGRAEAGAASLAELSLDTGDPATVPALPGLLTGADPRASSAVGRALLAHALRMTEPVDPSMLGLEPGSPVLRPVLDGEVPVWTPEDLHRLFAAVARAVALFDEHRSKEVLLAALVLLEGPRRTLAGRDVLAELARDTDSEAGRTLRSAFRRARAPIARQRAWLWARERALAAACTERIARAPTVADHAVVLELAHLALSPARAAHLAIVPIATKPAPGDELPPGVRGGRRLHPGGPVPEAAVVRGLPATLRRQLPRLVAALQADEPTRATALEPLLVDADPPARLAASRCLSGDDARDYCFDHHPRIAAHAALRLSSVGVSEGARLRAGHAPRRRLAAALARSPHNTVRAWATAEHDRVSPGWRSAAQLLAARRLHASDPGALADSVRAAADSGDVSELVGWLMAARRIGAVSTIEPQLLAIVRDSLAAPGPGECRAAATAAACLGELRSVRSRGVLEECLATHPDARVRANAAEALGRTEQREALAAANDEHHRVRASLVRAMLRPWPEPKAQPTTQPATQPATQPDTAAAAADTLGDMLTDPRPAHRLAAVWVVQRSLRLGLEGGIGRRWERLAGRVRWLADEDTDAGVRARASLVTTRLDAAMAGLGPRAPLGAPA